MATLPSIPGRPTRAQCIDAAAADLATHDQAIASMTPREQAEAAWTPTSGVSVEELEDEIRAQRGMKPLVRTRTA